LAASTTDIAKRLERLPWDLHEEFPDVPFEAIEQDVRAGAEELVASARFNDFVPVLVHRAVRDQLRAGR
jgi:hypothetical protein